MSFRTTFRVAVSLALLILAGAIPGLDGGTGLGLALRPGGYRARLTTGTAKPAIGRVPT